MSSPFSWLRSLFDKMDTNPSADFPSEGTACAESTRRSEEALFDHVSHELQTPLTLLSAALEQPELDRAEITQAVRLLQRNFEHLLAAARLEAGECSLTSNGAIPAN